MRSWTFKTSGWLVAVSCVAWLVSLVIGPGLAAQSARALRQDGHASVSFETSDNCLACHNGLTTADGEDVSIGVSWRASMMANSARDPYWQAAVRRETMDHPAKKGAIEDECAICHMPMARALARAAGREGDVFTLLPSARGRSDEHRLAADGVSCTLCHQIGPEGLGTRESFVGGFVIGAAERGTPRMLGPFDADAGRAALMRSATGVVPAKADHLRESELCATCHSLFTDAFGPDGTIVGSLPEQTPYHEWRHSAFAKERSCQSCHMPEAHQTPISSVVGEPRERLGRHTFRGGNFFVLRMLNRFRDELAVTAPSQELEAAAQATLRQLQTDTATIGIARGAVVGDRLEVDVFVTNLTGHKLPTGYPSRRAWVHLVVRDAAGRGVFESGAVEPDGRIAGNDNDTDATRVEPHYEEIRTSEQVQIYESVMADLQGRVTTGLLRATQFVKDNRLLPRGFDKRTADSDIAVRGDASVDADFTDDGDRIRYRVPLAGAAGPFTVDVELRYQPIGFRWANNLREYDAAETRRFTAYFDSMASASSTVLSRARMTARATAAD
jgi:hypothetical protein